MDTDVLIGCGLILFLLFVLKLYYHNRCPKCKRRTFIREDSYRETIEECSGCGFGGPAKTERSGS